MRVDGNLATKIARVYGSPVAGHRHRISDLAGEAGQETARWGLLKKSFQTCAGVGLAG